jgi:hypothetical protein
MRPHGMTNFDLPLVKMKKELGTSTSKVSGLFAEISLVVPAVLPITDLEWVKVLRPQRIYEGMKIAGAKGITTAQLATLQGLEAITY